MTSPWDGSEAWIQLARVSQRAGYLTKKSRYQENALIAILRYETELEFENRRDSLRFIADALMMVTHPKAYREMKQGRDEVSESEGNVDEVIYHGEENSDELREWGIDLEEIWSVFE